MIGQSEQDQTGFGERQTKLIYANSLFNETETVSSLAVVKFLKRLIRRCRQDSARFISFEIFTHRDWPRLHLEGID